MLHIQLPGTDDVEIFHNRKGQLSVNMQRVSDCTGLVTDVVARWPGSTPDSTIFHNYVSQLTIVLRLQLAGQDIRASSALKLALCFLTSQA